MSAPVPILFVDRDGTLITEPDDFQVDAFEKLRFVDGVIPAMLRLRDAGWQFVMVTNQDGLGTDAFPQAAFDGPHALMLQVFASQGITFREVLVDTSFERDNSPNRKPPGSGDARGIATQFGRHAQPRECGAHGAEVGAAGIDDHQVRHDITIRARPCCSARHRPRGATRSAAHARPP